MRIIEAMTTINLTGDRIRIEFRLWEKVAGLVRDQDIPVSAVRSATVAPDGLAAARGLRAPGLGLPGLRLIGTWRRIGEKSLVSVRRGQPAVLLELEGVRFDRVLVTCPHAQEYVDRLAAAGTETR